MSIDRSYPHGVPYRPPRPRGENTAAGTIGLALLGLVVTSNPIGALVGGAVGNALGSQPPTLENAVRSYFSKQGLDVVGFYRFGPLAVQVLFRHGDQYWMVNSRAQESSDWTLEALDDWLYGDIVEFQLPAKLSQIALLP